ncbi:6126_t:CDS:2, partial [Funneliformis mosseae]
SKMPKEERFKGVENFIPKCIYCDASNTVECLSPQKEGVVKCSGCNNIIPFASILTQLTFKVRTHVKKYYNGLRICDEQSCLYKTRQITYSKNCINRGCNGKMKIEYDEQMLYIQLLYLSQLFDMDKARNNGAKIVNEVARLKGSVDKYLDQNALRYVNLGELFAVD